jgi:hypothetical protein
MNRQQSVTAKRPSDYRRKEMARCSVSLLITRYQKDRPRGGWGGYLPGIMQNGVHSGWSAMR